LNVRKASHSREGKSQTGADEFVDVKRNDSETNRIETELTEREKTDLLQSILGVVEKVKITKRKE
jgi:hypothetical protein